MKKRLLSILLVVSMLAMTMTAIVSAEGTVDDGLSQLVVAVNNAGAADEMRSALENPELGLNLEAYNSLDDSSETLTRTRAAISMIYERPYNGYADKVAIQVQLDSIVARLATIGPDEVLPTPAPGTSLSADPSFFPIAAWLNGPWRVWEDKSMGINTIVGLSGPLTDQYYGWFEETGMKLIAPMDESTLKYATPDDNVIIGWAQEDEPDNAQDTGSGYGPSVDPGSVITRYNQIKAIDPTRPVFLNVGQGASWYWYGRGIDTGKDYMYPQYLQGADIACFDVYPVNTDAKDWSNNGISVKDKLWLVAKGIDNLRTWTDDKKPAWAWIETGSISGLDRPTPEEIKAEVWMALVHGAKGIGYFTHEFWPTFYENGLYHDPANDANQEMVTSINHQITELAPVLNSATTSGYATVESSNTEVPVDIMTKDYNGAKYIFAVGMRNGDTTATFNITEGYKVEVVGENRIVDVNNGKFSDDFAPYGVHIYKILSDSELLSRVDELFSMVNEGYASGRITNEGILNSLLAKMNIIQIYSGENYSRISFYNALNALGNEIEDQSGVNIDAEFATQLLDFIR